MDPNIQKCTFLAVLSIGLRACSLIFVAFLVIDVSPIIIERGMSLVGRLTREVLPETPIGNYRKKISELLQ